MGDNHEFNVHHDVQLLYFLEDNGIFSILLQLLEIQVRIPQ
jgi:hypothetical protein